jgi:hypothetical protein
MNDLQEEASVRKRWQMFCCLIALCGTACPALYCNFPRSGSPDGDGLNDNDDMGSEAQDQG